MLGVTAAIVVTTVASFLMKGDEPAEAAAAETAPAAAPAVAPVAASVAPTPALAGSAQVEDDQKSPIFIAQVEFQRQLDRSTRAPIKAMFQDPFRFVEKVVVVDAPKTVVHPKDLPSVSGLYFSSASDRGAVINGELVFLNGKHGDFKLAGVHDNGVTLEREGREYRIEYDPLTGGGPVKGSPE